MKATNNPDMMQWIRVKLEQIYGSSQVLLVVLWLIPALNLGSCLHSAYSGHKVPISVWDKEKCVYILSSRPSYLRILVVFGVLLKLEKTAPIWCVL